MGRFLHATLISARYKGRREAEFVAGEAEQLACFGFFFTAQPSQLHQRGAVDTGQDRVEGDLDQLIGRDVLAEPFADCCHTQRLDRVRRGWFAWHAPG